MQTSQYSFKTKLPYKGKNDENLFMQKCIHKYESNVWITVEEARKHKWEIPYDQEPTEVLSYFRNPAFRGTDELFKRRQYVYNLDQIERTYKFKTDISDYFNEEDISKNNIRLGSIIETFA